MLPLIEFCQRDQTRILNNNGAAETMKGLANITLIHNVFDQVAAAGGHNVGAAVGAFLKGEDPDGVGVGHRLIALGPPYNTSSTPIPQASNGSNGYQNQNPIDQRR